MSSSTKLVVWAIGLVIALALILSLMPFTVVGAGERGVVTRLGAYSRTIDPGLHWLTPATEDVTKFNVQVQKEQTEADAASADLQTVHATIAVNYMVDDSKVGDLYVQVGTGYKEKVIDPAVQEVVKAVTSKYTANDLQAKRPEVSQDMKVELASRLQPYFIIVKDISVVNFAYSPAFTQAIEAKVTADQNAQAEKNNLAAAQYKAQAIKITSEAANNEKYIQLQQLEVEKAAIAKWNGILPVQMIPNATLPFINLTK